MRARHWLYHWGKSCFCLFTGGHRELLPLFPTVQHATTVYTVERPLTDSSRLKWAHVHRYVAVCRQRPLLQGCSCVMVWGATEKVWNCRGNVCLQIKSLKILWHFRGRQRCRCILDRSPQNNTGRRLWTQAVFLFPVFQDRLTFRRIIVKNNAKKRKLYEAFIETLPLLTSLEVSITYIRLQESVAQWIFSNKYPVVHSCQREWR